MGPRKGLQVMFYLQQEARQAFKDVHGLRRCVLQKDLPLTPGKRTGGRETREQTLGTQAAAMVQEEDEEGLDSGGPSEQTEVN